MKSLKDGKGYKTDVADTATKEISKQVQPTDFEENRKVAKRGGGIAGNVRRDLE